ncbi:primosomal protein N' [Flavobacterium cauense R2A-7]|uniref:Replication restart protein PriA n=1 Tax=Flavobacterium cauense R2A-7 TaxID=1341154 RepID=V6RXX6_9FLAO|nr:primosomal protein N' [Flavobacterium cauense]ESU19303.1 primosomal protein N' [Flavobacterium cauense R2A-7]KGO82079.1 primosomal protein N' [Flavobacterium cauense R2A-7]TWI15026.1 replication restart DNA helicase PriA [Flavobacterium cauense R2A-7]
MPHFVEVVLPLALPKTFTYLVSEAEFQYIQKGMRVAVPFGKSKIYTALVIDLHQNVPTLYQAKEIHQILDEAPVVNEFQIEHWQWIANYYMCSIGEVFKSALPSGFLLESETIISAQNDVTIDAKELSDSEFLIYQALQQQSSLKVEDIVSILGKKNVFPILNAMLAKNVLLLQEEVAEKYKPKLTRYIRLQAEFLQQEQLSELMEILSRAQKQRELVLHYFQLNAKEKKPISVKKLLETSGSTSAVVKSLVDKEIFEEYYIAEDRVSFEQNTDAGFQLSQPQQKAFEEVKENFGQHAVTLLHGVTASGKTEIYIKLIEEYIAKGEQVLYLLPEIALTTQLVTRLTAYFGNQVAVFHSKYSNNERIEVWNQVLQNSDKAKIVIGARSALFLPFSNLGLIVIDEEHEQTFKQFDPAPRYHARDAAIVLASQHKAKVLLGSATPSLETYHNVKAKKYGLVELFERYGNVVLPEIYLVDLKDKYKRKKMNGHFSDDLLEAMTEALSKGEQVILFQNRRGYSPFVECMTCGHVPQCPSCDVSLTYYKFKNQLRCHYCGHSIANPTHCHACQSVDLSTKGFGTEQIEIELKALFPEKTIGRMDQDTTRGKFGYEKIIDAFKNQEIDVLVGTQMLAKGLHFDNVTLVGVMNADNMLNQPDFRSHERAYQMMMQVSGRAGRSEKRGKVMIQTYNPYHNIIQQVVNNDYSGMYNEQVYERHNFKYPPYYRLVKLTLKHRDFDKLKEGSLWLYNVLVQQLQLPVLGPEEPAISRIRNEYIRTILIKIPNQNHLGQTKKTIQRVLNSFEAVAQYRAIKVTLNVDNY